VTGVTVNGVAATLISSNMWRAILTGQVTISASNITLTTGTSTLNAINTAKASLGMFNDAYVRVTLLSGITPTSVTLSDGTVLTYSAANGDYEVDKVYTGTVPTTVNVVVTTATGSQTVTLPVN
jgi:hypothetical protein